MKKVDYEHFARFVYPCNLETRGENIYYTIKRADFEENKYFSDLYVLNDGVSKQLTSLGDVSAYYLLDDGIYFTSIRSDKDKKIVESGKPLTVLYRMPYDGGEATEVLRLEMNVSRIFFVNNKQFYFTSLYSHAFEKALDDSNGNVDKAITYINDDEDYRVYDEIPFWFNGRGIINKLRNRLYFYDGSETKPLVDEYTNIHSTSLSFDKKTLVYTTKRYTDKEPVLEKMYKINTTDFAIKEISIEPEMYYWHLSFVGNNELIVGASDGKRYGENQNPDIYLLDTKENTTTKLYDEGMMSLYGSVGSEVKMGRSIANSPVIYDNKYYFINTVNDTSCIMSIDIKTGAIDTVTKKRGIVSEFVGYQKGFVAICMRDLLGSEVYTIDNDGNENRLTSMNTKICEEYASSEIMDICFQNEDDVTIHGFVIAPVDYKKGEKYPTILDIHGGPKTVYGNVYFHEMQLWANMGYAVIYCNPTGGDGRGNEFTNINGRYGSVDYNDIMTFVDKCIEEFDFIDVDRLGVTGGSYGGFMTNWIIGHTNRFKAAASQRSISNWISFAGISDCGYSFIKEQNGATMWEDLEKVWGQSPLKYADKVTTPTLFIHSDEDYRCPLAEGIQMFSALKFHGIPARIVVFKGENHELSRSGKPKHRVRRLKEITQWFEKYLK